MHYDSKAEEIAPPLFPQVLENLILEYTKKEDFPNMPAHGAPQFTLFGRPFLDFPHSVTELGNMILRSEEKDVETVLAYVRKNPALLDIKVTAIDPCGTPVTGNLLQIAAMAGDVDLKESIKDEKQRGMVERLAIAGGLSDKKVANDLL